MLIKEPVTTSDEVLAQDVINWQCAGDWLDSLRGWQEWYKKQVNLL
ncbi:MAG: hypothetical protein [Podoviridae sp. ctLUJ1]|nr:MAG: hypothetical protein [Podoviridae sp. ctLUJ1]